MILVLLAITAIAIGVIGTAVTGALSTAETPLRDPAVLFFVAVLAAGVIGLGYLAT